MNSEAASATPVSKKLQKIELEADEARLRADYSVGLPPALRRWRKHAPMSPPSAACIPVVLEDLISAEASLYSLLSKFTEPASAKSVHSCYSIFRTDSRIAAAINSASTSGSECLQLNLVNDALAALRRALTALNTAYGACLPIFQTSGSPIDLAWPKDFASDPAISVLRRTNALYFQISCLRARCYLLLGKPEICQSILETELADFFSAPSKSKILPRGPNFIYFAMAFSMRAECTLFMQKNSKSENDSSCFCCSVCSCHDGKSEKLSSSESGGALGCDLFPPKISLDIFEPLLLLSPVSISGVALASLSQFSMGLQLNAEKSAFTIPENVLSSPHFFFFLPNSLFLAAISTTNHWFQCLIPDVKGPPKNLGHVEKLLSSESSKYNVLPDEFLILTYRALDFMRSFFIMCVIPRPVVPSTSTATNIATMHVIGPDAAFRISSPSYPQISEAYLVLLLAPWAIRFLVLWDLVVVRKSKGPAFVEYLICPQLDSPYAASTVVQELETIFNVWFTAIGLLHPFPEASFLAQKSPKHINKLMEDLAATLAWCSLNLNENIPSTIKILESTMNHTFHSLLCIRLLAMTHFKMGNIVDGSVLTRRYVELALEMGKVPDENEYPTLYHTERTKHLICLFKNIGIPECDMFVTREDKPVHAIRLLAEASYRLLDINMVDDAVDFIKQGESFDKFTNGIKDFSILDLLSCQAAAQILYSRKATDLPEIDKFRKDASLILKKLKNFSDKPCYRLLYLMALIEAENKNLSEAKNLIKQSLKLDPAHPQSWHLLTLILTAESEAENAIRISEIGIRQSLLSSLPKESTESSMSIFDLLSTFVRYQQLNQKMTINQYDEYAESLFLIKITQSRLIEDLRGVGMAISCVQELFRWYKLIFDEEVKLQDLIRLRAESMRSMNSSWPDTSAAPQLSSSTESLQFRLQSRRKRTLLAAVLAPDNNEYQSSGEFDVSPQGYSLHEDTARKERQGSVSMTASAAAAYIASNSSSHGTLPAAGQSNRSNQQVQFNSRLGNSVMSAAAAATAPTTNGSTGGMSSSERSLKRILVLVRLWVRFAQALASGGHLQEAGKALSEAESAISDVRRRFERQIPLDLMGELGSVNYVLGCKERAIAHWKSVLEQNPYDELAVLGIATTQFDRHRTAEAETLVYDFVAQSGADSANSWYFYGKLCKARGDGTMALSCFQRALKCEKLNPRTPYNILPAYGLWLRRG